MPGQNDTRNNVLYVRNAPTSGITEEAGAHVNEQKQVSSRCE